MSDPIRRQILHHAEATELQRAALATGMRPMFQDGIGKAAAGITTIEEVLRVTREVD
jgi:general secretion pathway protein E